jgi:hypothetical protein
MRRCGLAIALVLVSAPAAAQDPSTSPAQIDLEKDARGETATGAPPEAPPPQPYKKSFVLDTTVGASFFLGAFGKVAPPGPLFRTQLGYEVFKFFMILAEAELSFTDTSRAQDPPRVRAFGIFGFGAGGRFTVHITDRVGIYVQPTIGGLKADVPTNGLGIIGFRNAESFGLYTAIRAGLEWYQLDRHFALGLTYGFRSASGFEKTTGSDAPLVTDVGASLRYAF